MEARMNNPLIKAADFRAMIHHSLNQAWKQAYHGATPCTRKPRKGSKRAYWAAGPTGLNTWPGVKDL